MSNKSYTEIGLAVYASQPPTQNSFLIALHGKGGDGDHGDGLQIIAFLHPFGYLGTGDFRQLDIHQDQIRALFARDG